MEVSSKDFSRARYKLSQSRKRANRRKHSSHGSHAAVRDSHTTQETCDRDLSEDEADVSEQGADFGKLLQEASEYYGHAAHKKAAMLDALVAPQPTLNVDINASQVLDVGLLGKHVQAVPMYQVFGIHPGFSEEKYRRVHLSAPEEAVTCTIAEPTRIPERIDAQELTAAPAIHATPPITSGESPKTALPWKPVLPSAATSGRSAVEKGTHAGPSKLSAPFAAGGVKSAMDLDLDNLLAATSPATPSGTAAHAHSIRQAPAVTSTSRIRSSQQIRQTPAKNAKKALEDWLDL